MSNPSKPPSKPSIFVVLIDLKLADKLKIDLNEQGFELSVPAYTVFSAKKKGVSCTLYQSGKLTVQGKEMGAFMEFYLEPEILKDFNYTYKDVGVNTSVDTTPRIGIDESGKGDFFGPLCVGGVYAEGESIAKLKAMGVRDSKAMSDTEVLKVAKKIRADYAYHVVKINPLRYNELYEKFRNLNHLLAWGHATAIEQLVATSQCNNVIIDQFASEDVVISALKRKNLSVNLTQRHRGEEDIVVAAASIIARAAFLEGLEQLGRRWGLILPKGASAATIAAGKELVRKSGKEILGQVCKLHFKTLDAVIPKD